MEWIKDEGESDHNSWTLWFDGMYFFVDQIEEHSWQFTVVTSAFGSDEEYTTREQAQTAALAQFEEKLCEWLDEIRRLSG